ncbi:MULTISPECIES: alpha/beta fold hydrolase [unclassified Paenibacillus]|uniref:alpha/beta hydrolase family protein n=1 Tax=unclassified Paenibacillus TaxID=185978 RepID=UPI0024076CB7|nr:MULTISPECIES: alpha/beta fold hydrolase [unclassified Paenibacillus]MDF9843326.1 pimeloyl-ACP methyl ester carboxylesterase [Paenibacillus sp. PastF-2]MDF9849914.1 pimeloyl-ACP methyl ester carboxylesterase [Paenibacillus sp. PastM-2]MDF9856622.1 pimeloyl-ACP methyl ester carboxylesterase [Paenibacillus sp. PastF-1]MDH6481891.1 pimeloyl-ACP methyl ester carboxylesterase [Paenibacillus sp. PastH-2]MDH6509317.1 pimeloyl-ACP methyl ester carboxylesterase [Paenibacillus sp. PastM-3]
MNRNFELPAGEDAVLRCSHFPARSKAKSLIVIAHGYKGFKDWGMFPYTAAALSHEHEVISFNFSHAGIGEDLQHFTELEKFARNTYNREIKDMELLLSYLSQHHKFGALPLFLLGHSRGAGDSLLYALDHPDEVAGVISWNGITDLDLFTGEQKQEMRTLGRSHVLNGRTGQQMPQDAVILEDLERQAERYNILERMKSASFPVVLIQGTDDSARLRQGSEQLTRLRPDISWVQIAGGDHTFCTVHPFAGATPQLEQAIAASEAFIGHILENRSLL